MGVLKSTGLHLWVVLKGLPVGYLECSEHKDENWDSFKLIFDKKQHTKSLKKDSNVINSYMELSFERSYLKIFQII